MKKMKKEILIIEDEKMLAEMYKERFEQEGFHIHSAFDAEEGMNMVKELKPDLIILDILLPRENGVEFLRKMREIKELSSISVVAFSNYDDLDTKKEALALGAKEYLIKTNYTPSEILKKVIYYLEN